MTLISLLIAVCLVCQFFLYTYSPSGLHEPRSVKVLKGETFYNIAKNFEKDHLIANNYTFTILARFLKIDKKIKSGIYSLSPAMSPFLILQKLSSGNIELTKVVFPEGYTIELMGLALEQANIVSKNDFVAYAHNPHIARSLGIQADSLEGYLFPDTYSFSQNSSPEAVVKTLLNRFWTIFDESFCKRAEEVGFSIHDVVTFASIVEKETGQANERPIISSVFHNRLKRNMRLESDPTVIYGIKNFDGNLTRKHLNTKTPYNTYRIKGLPHGPIANPGEQSIRAALYPETSKYLYFVSKQDGTHHFSTNLKSHNRAVNLYQRKKRTDQSKNG
ncbi:aminodeoxychorismate lyase [Candidatus Magnetomorum sp. HK-1]|nr:aminodeoxychorismate lyase [Candidatus Magnetomorum sp. HK-1]